jgi:Uma2 family endonuclease
MATGLDGFGPAGEFTVENLERMPDDGRRYELLDGVLLVSPAPGVWHQEVAGTPYRLLYQACPPELHVVIAPFEWRRDKGTALQSDVLVACRDDRLSKLSAYEEAGVASYGSSTRIRRRRRCTRWIWWMAAMSRWRSPDPMVG